MFRSRLLSTAFVALLPSILWAAPTADAVERRGTDQTFVERRAPSGAIITRIVPTSPDDPDGAGSGDEPDTGWQFWPNTYDGITPNQMRVDFEATADGTYQVYVLRGRWIYAESDPVTLTAGGASSWTWDGVEFTDIVSDRGYYEFQVVKPGTRGRYEPASPTSASFELRNSVGQIFRGDSVKDRSGSLNIKEFHLVNAPHATSVEFGFAKPTVKSELYSIGVGIDVSGSKRGYLLTAVKDNGSWKTRLAYVLLASDSKRYERIKCPKASIETTADLATAVVPRSCMPYGGSKARIYFSVSSRDYKSYDYGPDRNATGPTNYWTDWVRWTVEPPS